MTNVRHCAPRALAVAVLAAVGATAAQAAPAVPTERACFASNNWEGWSAPGDGDALYLKVGMRDVYRVELTPGTHVHKHSDYFLINRVRGSNWICSALDLDLSLADHQGFQQPLIARTLRKLTPEEVTAIPKKDRP